MLTDNATAFWTASAAERKAHVGKVICGQDVGSVVPRLADKHLGLFPARRFDGYDLLQVFYDDELVRGGSATFARSIILSRISSSF